MPGGGKVEGGERVIKASEIADAISAIDAAISFVTASEQIDLRAALAKREIRLMAEAAREYIDASVERYTRSAGQSRRQWNIKRRGK